MLGPLFQLLKVLFKGDILEKIRKLMHYVGPLLLEKSIPVGMLNVLKCI